MDDEYDKNGNKLCDEEGCGKRATVNYQTGTVRWDINRLGRYVFDELFDDGMTNEHWCDEHDESNK